MSPPKPMTVEELKAATTISEEELNKLKSAVRKKKYKSRSKSRPFIMVPVVWVERLRSCRSRAVYPLMLYLLRREFQEKGKSFPLGNDALGKGAASRFAKRRALLKLEELRLISVEWRSRKSPLILVHRMPL
jgi:hypothetical protein